MPMNKEKLDIGLTPEREKEYREWASDLGRIEDRGERLIAADLLAEVDRLRDALARLQGTLDEETDHVE
jgi:hypothetical protein